MHLTITVIQPASLSATTHVTWV